MGRTEPHSVKLEITTAFRNKDLPLRSMMLNVRIPSQGYVSLGKNHKE